MSHAITTYPPHERFNNLCPADSLERFAYFELVACRVETQDDCVVQCGAAQAEFWTIYGRASVGTAPVSSVAASQVRCVAGRGAGASTNTVSTFGGASAFLLAAAPQPACTDLPIETAPEETVRCSTPRSRPMP